MFYFHWLALCVLSCSLLVYTLPDSMRCGRFVQPEHQELARQDCMHAIVALFTRLPCPRSEFYRERTFSHQTAFGGKGHERLMNGTDTGYRLPKVGTYGVCTVSLAASTSLKTASATISQLAEDMVYLYEQCVRNRQRKGGYLLHNGLALYILTGPPASRRRIG
jgi:hypothetical protein